MVWSEYIPLPLVLPPEAGPNDSRVVIDANGIIIYNGATPVIELIPTPSPEVLVISGNLELFMFVDNTAVPPTPTLRFKDISQNHEANIVFHSTGTAGQLDMFAFEGTNIVGMRMQADGANSNIVTKIPIRSEDPVNGNFIPEFWHTLTLANLWVTDTLTPQYRLMPDGTVLLQGLMKNGTTAGGTVIGTLPAGYRPLQQQRFISAEQSLGTAFRHIAVQTNGDLKVFNCTTAFICIDGIRFPVI